MINGTCFTNLDEFQSVSWPDEFVALPMVGDYVEGILGDKLPTLRVVAVTHSCDRDGNPRVILELHR